MVSDVLIKLWRKQGKSPEEIQQRIDLEAKDEGDTDKTVEHSESNKVSYKSFKEPFLTSKIYLCLTPEIKSKISKTATDYGMSRSEFIRRLFFDYFKEQGKK